MAQPRICQAPPRTMARMRRMTKPSTLHTRPKPCVSVLATSSAVMERVIDLVQENMNSDCARAPALARKNPVNVFALLLVAVLVEINLLLKLFFRKARGPLVIVGLHDVGGHAGHDLF